MARGKYKGPKRGSGQKNRDRSAEEEDAFRQRDGAALMTTPLDTVTDSARRSLPTILWWLSELLFWPATASVGLSWHLQPRHCRVIPSVAAGPPVSCNAHHWRGCLWELTLLLCFAAGGQNDKVGELPPSDSDEGDEAPVQPGAKPLNMFAAVRSA
jgi:hypothetical protein